MNPDCTQASYIMPDPYSLKIIYIDNNEAAGRMFCLAAKSLSIDDCTIIHDARKSIVHFIESKKQPDFIFINCVLKDVLCRSIVEFIYKQDHLKKSRIVLLSNYLSKRDTKMYMTFGVAYFEKYSVVVEEIRLMLQKFIINPQA